MAPAPKSNRSAPFAIWGSALILIVLAIYAVRTITREQVSVVVANVTYKDLTKTIPTTGKVELTDDFDFHAQAAGQVREIYVDDGQMVKAGQLLLRMDDKYALANLAHANATLQSAQSVASDIQHGGTQDERNTTAADLRRAQIKRQQDAADLAAKQKLLQQGAVSPAEVAAAQQLVQLDDSNIQTLQQHATQRYGAGDLARAQAELADARAAVTAAQSSYDSVDIRTPISGTVYNLPVAQYDYVNAGDELISVADLTRKRVTAYFDEPDIGALAVGQPVLITWQAEPLGTWHGHVTQVPTTIVNYFTRFVGECIVTLDDANDVLKPDANVNVVVTTAKHTHVLSVPRAALRGPMGQTYVFRVIKDKLVRTPVQTGIINLDQVEITSGLSEGETVALNATTDRSLTDGLQITPVH